MQTFFDIDRQNAAHKWPVPYFWNLMAKLVGGTGWQETGKIEGGRKGTGIRSFRQLESGREKQNVCFLFINALLAFSIF